MVYYTYNYSYKVYKPTHNWGAPHWTIVGWFPPKKIWLSIIIHNLQQPVGIFSPSPSPSQPTSEAPGTGAGILPTLHPAPDGGPDLLFSRSEAAAAEGSLGRKNTKGPEGTELQMVPSKSYILLYHIIYIIYMWYLYILYIYVIYIYIYMMYVCTWLHVCLHMMLSLFVNGLLLNPPFQFGCPRCEREPRLVMVGIPLNMYLCIYIYI
jgi:hypothetical protein